MQYESRKVKNMIKLRVRIFLQNFKIKCLHKKQGNNLFHKSYILKQRRRNIYNFDGDVVIQGFLKELGLLLYLCSKIWRCTLNSPLIPICSGGSVKEITYNIFLECKVFMPTIKKFLHCNFSFYLNSSSRFLSLKQRREIKVCS